MKQRLLLLTPLALLAADPPAPWPQWMGPSRDGRASGFQAPASWPKSLTLQWSANLGEGYSSPVADQRSVFVHSRRGDEEFVTCLDRSTGNVRWQHHYPSPFQKSSYARNMAPAPFATPVLSGGVLYALGANAVLTAFDSESGRVRWQRKPAPAPTTEGLFTGTAASPLVDEDRLIVFWGDDRSGELAALDPASGKTIWSFTGDHPVYSSPVAAAIAGVRQYIVLAERNAIAVDAASGRLLWQVPYKDQWNENIVTPAVSGDTVFLGGVRKPTTAWRIERVDGAFRARELWSNAETAFYMGSPVFDGAALWGLSTRNKGQLVAIDATSGKKLYSSEGRYAEHAHAALAGPWLLLMTGAGELIVLSRNPARPAEIARYNLAGSSTMSFPAFAGKQIFIRDLSSLRAFALP